MPSLSYFVCATKRTGSSLLCEFLSNSQVAADPVESFTPLYSLWHGKVERRYGTSTFADFIRALRQSETFDGVFAAKIFWHELPLLLPPVRELLDLPDASDHDLLNAAFPNLHYVWIRRRDRLRQAISLVRALQSKVWSIRDSWSDRIGAPDFDYDEISDCVQRLTDQDEGWKQFFQDHGIRPFTLFYEDLVDDPAGMTRQVLRYLGIELSDTFVFPAPWHEKQSDELTEDWICRYRLISRSRSEGWTPSPAIMIAGGPWSLLPVGDSV